MNEGNDLIVAIGAHPDDIELGCGGILSRHICNGDKVLVIIMTAGERGHDGGYNRTEESRKSLLMLGVKRVMCFDFDDTGLGNLTQHMIGVIEECLEYHFQNERPYRVYTMCASDRHQDHRAVYEASIVACRKAKQILCYETPSTWLSFRPNIYLNITENEFNKKILALQEHHSQRNRDYMKPEQIHSIARFRGQQVGCELSEAFAIHKMVI